MMALRTSLGMGAYILNLPGNLASRGVFISDGKGPPILPATSVIWQATSVHHRALRIKKNRESKTSGGGIAGHEKRKLVLKRFLCGFFVVKKRAREKKIGQQETKRGLFGLNVVLMWSCWKLFGFHVVVGRIISGWRDS
jgi:hypothetical protein